MLVFCMMLVFCNNKTFTHIFVLLENKQLVWLKEMLINQSTSSWGFQILKYPNSFSNCSMSYNIIFLVLIFISIVYLLSDYLVDQ